MGNFRGAQVKLAQTGTVDKSIKLVDRQELWKVIKPLRDAGMSYNEIAQEVAKKGFRSARKPEQPFSEASVCSTALVYGGQSYRSRRKGKRRTREEMEIALVPKVTPPPVQTAVGILATFHQIADISLSNLELPTKKQLLKQLINSL